MASAYFRKRVRKNGFLPNIFWSKNNEIGMSISVKAKIKFVG
jgi:hypothetical protein